MNIYYSKKKYFVQIRAPKVLQRNSQFLNLYNERITSQGRTQSSDKDKAQFVEKHPEYQTVLKKNITRTIIGARLTGLLPIVRRKSLSLHDELCQTFGLDENGIREKSVTLELEEADEICRNIVRWLNEKKFDFASAGKPTRSPKAKNIEFVEGLPDEELEGEIIINCKSSLSENQIQMAKWIEENNENILSALSDAVISDYKRTLPYYELFLATKSGTKSWFPSPERVTNPYDYFVCNKLHISRDNPMIGIEGQILWFPDLTFGAILERDISTIITMDPSDARL